MDDIVAWHYNSNVIFSVKSAYKVYVDDRKRRGNTSSAGSSFLSNTIGDQSWKQLWKINCPKKATLYVEGEPQ
jgi:hypothetical protein